MNLGGSGEEEVDLIDKAYQNNSYMHYKILK